MKGISCLVVTIVFPPIRALLSPRLAPRSCNSLRSIAQIFILLLVLFLVRRLVGGAVIVQIKTTGSWDSIRFHCLLGLSLRNRYEIQWVTRVTRGFPILLATWHLKGVAPSLCVGCIAFIEILALILLTQSASQSFWFPFIVARCHLRSTVSSHFSFIDFVCLVQGIAAPSCLLITVFDCVFRCVCFDLFGKFLSRRFW
jgi:hypothetical protein